MVSPGLLKPTQIMTSYTLGLLKSIVPVVLAFVAPIQSLLAAMLFVVLFDTLTGIWAARKRGEAVSSRKLSHVLSKLFLYLGIMLVAHAITSTMMPNIPLVSIVASTVALIEFTSVLENASSILGYDLTKRIMEKIKRKINSESLEGQETEPVNDKDQQDFKA